MVYFWLALLTGILASTAMYLRLCIKKQRMLEKSIEALFSAANTQVEASTSILATLKSVGEGFLVIETAVRNQETALLVIEKTVKDQAQDLLGFEQEVGQFALVVTDFMNKVNRPSQDLSLSKKKEKPN